MFLFPGSVVSCCFKVESHGANESVQVVGDALVEAIELGAPVMLETSMALNGLRKASNWSRD